MCSRCSGLVQLVLGRAASGVFHTAVVWHSRCISGTEVESTSSSTSQEDCGSTSTAVEVEPFGGLESD